MRVCVCVYTNFTKTQEPSQAWGVSWCSLMSRYMRPWGQGARWCLVLGARGRAPHALQQSPGLMLRQAAWGYLWDTRGSGQCFSYPTQHPALGRAGGQGC
jgi:hypothetical protein